MFLKKLLITAITLMITSSLLLIGGMIGKSSIVSINTNGLADGLLILGFIFLSLGFISLMVYLFLGNNKQK